MSIKTRPDVGPLADLGRDRGGEKVADVVLGAIGRAGRITDAIGRAFKPKRRKNYAKVK